MSPRTRSPNLVRAFGPWACLVLVLALCEFGGRQAEAQSMESGSDTMFPIPFSRVVEKRLLIDGELDHRWAVRESYWDHWLIFESTPAGSEGSGAATDGAGEPRTDDVAIRSRGRRRMIDLETGDVVEIDWAAGTYWRSTQARLDALVRRLQRAEGHFLGAPRGGATTGSSPRPREQAVGEGTESATMDVQFEPASASEPTASARTLDGLRLDSRLLASGESRAIGRRDRPRTVSAQVRRLTVRPGTVPLERSQSAESRPKRHVSADAVVLTATVSFDERFVLSARAVEALEALTDVTDPTTGLVTISAIAAEARAFTDGALPLAAEAIIRLAGSPDVAKVATLVESTVALHALSVGAQLVRVPPQLREVVPPLEAVVRRAELERRLDEGKRP